MHTPHYTPGHASLSISWLHIMGFLFQVVCLIVAFYGMIEAAKNNASTEMYFDLYCVTVASQVLSAISDWGWYLLIAIPLYGGYLAYGLWKSNPLSSLMGGGPVAPADDDDDAPASRKERRKVKYARK